MCGGNWSEGRIERWEARSSEEGVVGVEGVEGVEGVHTVLVRERAYLIFLILGVLKTLFIHVN